MAPNGYRFVLFYFYFFSEHNTPFAKLLKNTQVLEEQVQSYAQV